MHPYRTHSCAALRGTDAGQTARLSGWVHSKRDHGGLLFIDLRDHHGITQIVFPAGSDLLASVEKLRVESVITVTGEVVRREGATVNPKLATGEIELRARALEVQSASGRAAAAGRRHRELSGGAAAALPLHRPPPRQAAPQHDAARRRDREPAGRG